MSDRWFACGRQTHASLLLEAGEHPKMVQERLGHSTITTTVDIYARVRPTMQHEAAARVAALVQYVAIAYPAA
ncbi:hypothetical protein ACFT1A_02690 [Rhodococcus sp. NPDC057135]|uniref:hypothetical protein n=1 Tax=Rhodococcus sp. NPDC057135 TaxID=3346028 RepID=UPI003627939A